MGIVNDLGDLALRRVCQELPTIVRAVGRVPISVNLSAHQLSDPGFAARALAILAETGTDPHVLTIEVTETALMSNVDAALDALITLRRLGVRVALDDFGTGYSSLAYLKTFPIDVVKIDRSFVSGLGRDASDTLIVAAIINLAHTLGLTVVAEGVEGVTQIEELRRLDCRYAQGFVWSRAVPATDLSGCLVGAPPPLRPWARPVRPASSPSPFRGPCSTRCRARPPWWTRPAPSSPPTCNGSASLPGRGAKSEPDWHRG